MQTILEYLKRRKKQDYTGEEDIMVHYNKMGRSDGLVLKIGKSKILVSKFDDGTMDYTHAKELCDYLGMRLPLVNEMQYIDQHLKEINKLMRSIDGVQFGKTAYWTSTDMLYKNYVYSFVISTFYPADVDDKLPIRLVKDLD